MVMPEDVRLSQGEGGFVMGDRPIAGRMTADAHGDVVVFLIGMRFNSLLAVRSWWPVARAMPRMLRELSRERGQGLLGVQALLGRGCCTWCSTGSRPTSSSRTPRRPTRSTGPRGRRSTAGCARAGARSASGTRRTPCRPGGYESVYVNMPAFGLGKATGVVPVGRRGERAAERLKAV
ncbi:hypothetical protein GCM10020295_23500 [Streptomyces cinereospinus]